MCNSFFQGTSWWAWRSWKFGKSKSSSYDDGELLEIDAKLRALISAHFTPAFGYFGARPFALFDRKMNYPKFAVCVVRYDADLRENGPGADNCLAEHLGKWRKTIFEEFESDLRSALQVAVNDLIEYCK